MHQADLSRKCFLFDYAKAKTKFTTNMNWICLSDLILTSFEAAVRSTGYIKKNGVLGLNINSKEHKHSLLTGYTPFESPTIQLFNND